MDLSTFGTIGTLALGAAYLDQLVVSGLTQYWPDRPVWLPWLASLVLGIVFVALLALATGAFDGTLPAAQLTAQIVIVGIVAGGGAGGANAAAAAAERKRQQVVP